jgi:hypothetical protein
MVIIIIVVYSTCHHYDGHFVYTQGSVDTRRPWLSVIAVRWSDLIREAEIRYHFSKELNLPVVQVALGYNNADEIMDYQVKTES